MFTIIFRTKDSEVIEILPSVDGDEKYLVQEAVKYTTLKDSFDDSPSALNDECMNSFMAELDLLSDEVEKRESLEHIKKIKKLAEKCKVLKGSHLIITPFDIGI